MRRSGRPLGENMFPLIYVFVFSTFASASEFRTPIEIKLWDTGRKPVAYMVDVTNEFGLKVLAEHNFLNHNNIAFSPYGLMGILVALYEGVEGDSSYQLQRSMQLPWNRNVMRIGFRDIHRTLKTYFIPEEGFLAGLALNNENVTFNDSYKNILRFYGFDLDGDQIPQLPPQNNSNQTNGNLTTTTMATHTDATAVSMTTETKSTREDTETLSMESTTPTLKAEMSSNISESSTSSFSEMGKESSTTTATITVTSTAQTSSTNTNPGDGTDSSTPTTEITTPEPTVVMTGAVTTQSTTVLTSTTTVVTEPTINNEVELLSTLQVNTVDGPGTMMTDTTTSLSTISGITDSTTESPSSQLMSNEPTATENSSTTAVTERSLETLQRRKRSLVDLIYTDPPYVDDYLIKSYGQEGTSKFRNEKMFLANGMRNVMVTYMHYDSVLEYAYLPHLEASALRLPLDSERYYLLVVLPLRAGEEELSLLLGRMARESDLRDVQEALRPRRVRAMVPSFIVKGHITLTTDLQKLGIRDVFEPRQHDFTPMTPQVGVYVRSIEQAVSVAIRKYQPDDHKRNRYISSHHPVEFSATYPFLYFVMDDSIHVALMAGKMVDPLNTRIL